jgi:hypothetical protein
VSGQVLKLAVDINALKAVRQTWEGVKESLAKMRIAGIGPIVKIPHAARIAGNARHGGGSRPGRSGW